MEFNQLAELLNHYVVPEAIGTQVNPDTLAAYNATNPEIRATQDTARNIPAFLEYADSNELPVDYAFALNEDLSNFADFGIVVGDLDATQLTTMYQNLMLGIKDTWIRLRRYERRMPDIFIPSEEFGMVREIVMFGLDNYTVNDTHTLEGGRTYNQDIYHATGEDARVYSNKSLVEVEGSIPYQQLKSYFLDARQLNEFVSGVMLKLDNTMNLALDSIVQRVINAMIAKCDNNIHTVTEYNEETGESLTPAQALQDPDFYRWWTTRVGNVQGLMTRYNRKYNNSEIDTFTPRDSQHLTMIDMINNNLKAYLYSNTFHTEYLNSLGKFDTVPYWQTSGNALMPDFATVSDINVTVDGELDPIHKEKVMAVLYDDYAVGVSLRAGGENVRTHYNAKGDFLNYFIGQEVETLIDMRASAVCFLLD